MQVMKATPPAKSASMSAAAAFPRLQSARTMLAVLTLGAFVSLLGLARPAAAQNEGIAFKQALAVAAAKTAPIAEFYAARSYEPIWTGRTDAAARRRAAFLKALDEASLHALPTNAYGATALRQDLADMRSAIDLGELEVRITRSFLDYAEDIQSGVLTPSQVDSLIKRQAPRRDPGKTLEAFARSAPAGFLAALPPQTPEYPRLLRAKLQLEELSARGGWGPATGTATLKPGAAGPAVVDLRDRLMRMGYLGRTAATAYDGALTEAVRSFQKDHGLAEDGIAGPATLGELNRSVEERLEQLVVALERERWMNMPLGRRHVRVNLPDYSAQIVDDGRVTFQTRSVIGKGLRSHQSPEFSDLMEFMVINPTWNVPRSITTKEYLPKLQADPGAVGHLELVDSKGRVVSRGAVNFTAYSAATFPFRLREPPSQSNALGRVKFIFPNAYNIYLHDTPAKSLFSRETRAYSHGCIRLNDPFDFAYALLSVQTGDPVGFFKTRLNSGRETYVNLDAPVPVHLIYRTAFTQAKGRIQFRRDIYGRDAKVYRALNDAGVTLDTVRG